MGKYSILIANTTFLHLRTVPTTKIVSALTIISVIIFIIAIENIDGKMFDINRKYNFFALKDGAY